MDITTKHLRGTANKRLENPLCLDSNEFCSYYQRISIPITHMLAAYCGHIFLVALETVVIYLSSIYPQKEKIAKMFYSISCPNDNGF